MVKRKFFINKSQLEADYKELGSLAKVAFKHDVSKKLILNYMNKYNIQRNTKNSFKDTIKLIEPLIRSGLTTKEISEKAGCSTTNVWKVSKSIGVKPVDDFHKGYIVTHNGYKMVLASDHPHCDSKGYIREHRLIMEQHIGRYLSPDEVVHHINHDKLDNRIENLEITDLPTHTKEHHLGKVGRGPDLKPRKNSQVKI